MKKIVIALFFMLGTSFLGHYEKAEAYLRHYNYTRVSDFEYYRPFPIFMSFYPVTPTVPIPIIEPSYPTCITPVPGMSYITSNIYCSCPDGTIIGSNGGYNSCKIDNNLNPTVPTPYVPYPTVKTQSLYNNNSNCWNDCSNYNSFQNNYRSNSQQGSWNWY